MRLLLDTHTFLWWVSERGTRLSDRARDLLSDGANDVGPADPAISRYDVETIW